MAKVVPFKGLRYNTEKFKDLDMVTAPPYDIISAEEQQELYNKDEYNVIRWITVWNLKAMILTITSIPEARRI